MIKLIGLLLITTCIIQDKTVAYSLGAPPTKLNGASSRLAKATSFFRLGGKNEVNGESKPPSQVESIVSNSKSLQSRDVEDPKKDAAKYIQALAAGLAVSLAMVPEAVAFSFVAGVSPLVGLWTTVTLGFTAAAFGGRAGICSSASGACSVVVAALCVSHSPVYLSACALLAGLLQIAGGFLKLGKFIRLVPHPVMLGFVNGLAIVMTKGMYKQYISGVQYSYKLCFW